MSNTQKLPITLESLSISIESISQSIGKLATRDELKEVRDQVMKLPTRDEMNTAISDSFDELARMVAVGFKETNGMIYTLQRDFNGMESRFGDLADTVAINRGHRLRRIESKLQLA